MHPGGSFAEFRLPAGRHGLSPETVAENQRLRLLGGVAEALEECGYARLTSHAIAARAGVSYSTFYRHFDDVPGCLLAAYEMAAECVLEVVGGACEREGEWDARLAAAISATLEFLAGEPGLARLLGAEAPAGVGEVAAARARLIDRLASPPAGGRPGESAPGRNRPPAAERHLIQGAFALVSDRVIADGAERLPELAPQLTEIFVASSLAGRP